MRGLTDRLHAATLSIRLPLLMQNQNIFSNFKNFVLKSYIKSKQALTGACFFYLLLLNSNF